VAAHPFRSRLIPFKLLSLLLYAQDGVWMQTAEDGQTSDRILRLGPTARLLRVSSARLRDHLEWLLDSGFFISLELEHGRARIRLAPPRV
jgi:hypothetical protein